jgi:molybdenum cofactor biosynthesis enzyme MoaA
MKIQSASIDIPGGCPNDCKYCISSMTANKEFSRNVIGSEDRVFVVRQLDDRLQFLRDIGVSSLVITGAKSEPVFNREILDVFNSANRRLKSPFVNIDLQTSGAGLTRKTLEYLEDIGVKTISLSLSSFVSNINSEINQTRSDKYKVNIGKVCKLIKSQGFNLRLSLNMNNEGLSENNNISWFFEEANKLEADQITFRKLYYPEKAKDSDQAKWIEKNKPSDKFWLRLKAYIENEGRPINRLEFGAIKYSISGMSTVIDDDCMSKNNIESIKYAILRRNLKLYSEWDDPASLIF